MAARLLAALLAGGVRECSWCEQYLIHCKCPEMAAERAKLEEHIGKPKYFNVDGYLDAVEGMINADEVERAFLMLDNLPAYYRDHVPLRAREIRESLHRQLFTPVQYKDIYGEFDVDVTLKNLPGRAKVLRSMVAELNEKGLAPHIMEYAPGNFWLPIVLRRLALSFGYEHVGLEPAPAGLTSQAAGPVIFCAFEIIEHLSNEFELYQNYLRFNRAADVVLLSTPFYTCAGGEDNWRTRDLGHLRAYTPREFLTKAHQMFEGFEWQVVTDVTMILVGKRIK